MNAGAPFTVTVPSHRAVPSGATSVATHAMPKLPRRPAAAPSRRTGVDRRIVVELPYHRCGLRDGIEAIEARLPAARLAGPTTWCTGGGEYFAEFLGRRRAPLAFARNHFYPMACRRRPGSPEHATIANMLSPELMARTRACVDSAAALAASHGLALRVDETNSAFGFGQPGVSDVFASALWGADHLFTLAELGVAGVNIQTGTNASGGLTCEGVYLPICAEGGGYTARPLYYALLLFHQMEQGGRCRAGRVGGTGECGGACGTGGRWWASGSADQ
jgi:hypothetical protein